MQSTKGISVAGDVLVNETADGVNLNDIWRELQAALGVYNQHHSTIVRLLKLSDHRDCRRHPAELRA
jgi:hypothetical protein